METKIAINGRELEPYQLNNEELLEIVSDESRPQKEKELATKKIIERFKWGLCKESGETDNNVFVRFFSEFVNGKCHGKKDVAELMAREHRYLQQEMFKVCLEYIKKLSENYQQGHYDPRNEWACQTSSHITEAMKEKDWYI